MFPIFSIFNLDCYKVWKKVDVALLALHVTEKQLHLLTTFVVNFHKIAKFDVTII